MQCVAALVLVGICSRTHTLSLAHAAAGMFGLHAGYSVIRLVEVWTAVELW